MIDVQDEPPNFAERVCKKYHAFLPSQLFDPKVSVVRAQRLQVKDALSA